jgi:membrane protease YdiL (CAAX protease family)
MHMTQWRGIAGDWPAIALTLTLACGVPIIGYFRFRQLASSPAPFRLRLYARTIASQWLLVGLLWLVLLRHGLTFSAIGERPAELATATTIVFLVTAAIASRLSLYRVRRASPERLRRLREPAGLLAPRSPAEAAAFVGVCLTAGICEELLYRGWLVNYLWGATGSIWMAGATAGAIFGLGHAYQGIKGVLRTTFIGCMFVVIYVGLGSLIPGQVLHVAVDLIAGMVLREAAQRLDAAAAVSPEI